LTAAIVGSTLRAVTLTELLVSLALVAVVSLAALSVLEQGQRAWATGAARVESQQSARVALARLVADVRVAGFGGDGFDAVAIAEPARIVLQQDLDGDGAIAASGERVTWRLAGSILRRDAGGGAQPIVNGVRAFDLRYFDARGVVTAVPHDVRSVVVALTTAPDGAPAPTPTATVSTRIRLRNR
jgi:prepilin-type N-terminal cleavage/methylation domain-containing protein